MLTMFIGNLSALLQDDIKRLLSFSTIANTGYIILGLSFGSTRALAGSLFHMFNHSIIKALLFFCAGAFIYRTKTRSLKDLAGIRKKMPITSTFFLLGTLSLASIPPLNIFWSELMILVSGVEEGFSFLSFLMILNLVLSAVYCLRLIQIIAIKKEKSVSKRTKEVSILMLLPIIILGLISLLIGFYPGPLQTLVEAIAQTVLNP
jgi:formate hydrogenlyase subunit 3/multisubunit Na+/H+ antiporter MnhD subunit